jgi:hypothetical protein
MGTDILKEPGQGVINEAHERGNVQRFLTRAGERDTLH